jgi:sec-independent protein translocase protein TatA
MGLQEWILCGILALIVIFGARRIGDIGTGLGEGIKNFKKAVKDEPKSEEGRPPSASNP